MIALGTASLRNHLVASGAMLFVRVEENVRDKSSVYDIILGFRPTKAGHGERAFESGGKYPHTPGNGRVL